MSSVSFFLCHACKLILSFIYTHDSNFTWGGGGGARGLFRKFIAAEKCIVLSKKFM